MSAEAWAIIPAGGSGSRFSPTEDKLLALLAGTPVLVRTLQALLDTGVFTGIVLVASAANQARYASLIQQHLPKAPIRFALGGQSRRESVYNGLLALPDLAKIVAVHDAARPLIRPETVRQAVTQVQQGTAGVIVAVPIHDTVKQATAEGNSIERTLDRNRLWRAQTPQVFQTQTLLQAHRQIAADVEITDDAQLLELAGLGPVALVPGDEGNLKITDPHDIRLAEALLERQ